MFVISAVLAIWIVAVWFLDRSITRKAFAEEGTADSEQDKGMEETDLKVMDEHPSLMRETKVPVLPAQPMGTVP